MRIDFVFLTSYGKIPVQNRMEQQSEQWVIGKYTMKTGVSKRVILMAG